MTVIIIYNCKLEEQLYNAILSIMHIVKLAYFLLKAVKHRCLACKIHQGSLYVFTMTWIVGVLALALVRESIHSLPRHWEILMGLECNYADFYYAEHHCVLLYLV
jgi:hypothetical protein